MYMIDEELEKRLALIEERALRLELSGPGIASGDQKKLDQSGDESKVESRMEALLQFLEKSPGGITRGVEETKAAGCSEDKPRPADEVGSPAHRRPANVAVDRSIPEGGCDGERAGESGG
jgi:hypothetical protein